MKSYERHSDFGTLSFRMFPYPKRLMGLKSNHSLVQFLTVCSQFRGRIITTEFFGLAACSWEELKRSITAMTAAVEGATVQC
jgi:hypothetical protein